MPIKSDEETDMRQTRLALALPALALIGMAISAYLTYVHWFAIEPICGDLAECEIVNSSVYSAVYGVPVALLGFLTYGALLMLGGLNLRYDGRYRSAVKPGILGLAVAGVLYSAYLTHIELNVLHAICIWCVGSAVTISVILIVAIFMVKRDLQHDSGSRAVDF